MLNQLYALLSPAERRQVLWLLPLLTLTAVVEVVGIASVLPFLAIVADPTAIERSDTLSWLYTQGGFADSRGFLIAVGLLMFLFIVVGNGLTALSTYSVLRFSWLRNHSLSLRLLASYLARPYSFFLTRHSADLGKNLVSEVQQVVAGVVVPVMQVIAKGLAAIAVVAFLFYVDPGLAGLTSLLLGGAYALIFFFIRRRQRLIGQQRVAANKSRYETLAEAFGGIKEIKLLQREEDVLRRFERPSRIFAEVTARNSVVGQLPRFALETVAFGGIVLMVLYLLRSAQPIGAVLPIIGLYAFAGYRLMPSLQRIFVGLTTIRFNLAALEELFHDLPGHGFELRRDARAEPMPLRREVALRDVTFRYPSAEQALFDGLNLVIPAGSSVALVGETGSGKSTLADLVLGLLRPEAGTLEVDGRPVTDELLGAWQANLGYVPQTIFLSNDSIRRNIAFGLPDEEIDDDDVQRAARVACIHDFVLGELPEGYDTVVGERGVRLSGGQRQRIGIARAVYRDPSVFVFDEATSSLDTGTESQVMEAIGRLGEGRTVLAIAHRLSTVRDYDHIFLFAGGRVEASGTYDDLLRSSARFRALAAPSGTGNTG